MTCFFCKGEMENTTTKYIVDLGKCVVIVKNVPARKCKQCGEVTFSDDVAQQLERIVDAVKASMMSEVAIIEYKAA